MPAVFFLTLPWILLVILFFPAFKLLALLRWEAVDYTHAYFILPLTLAMIWSRRHRLGKSHQNIMPFGTLMASVSFMLGLALYWFGWQWDYLLIQTLSLLPLVFGLAGLLYGFSVSWELRFPILYLAFLVPPPVGTLDSLTLPLRALSSVVAENGLHLLRYPVSREGLLLFLGDHQIFMGAPCSGFRSLVTFLALGTAFVFFRGRKFPSCVLMVMAIVPLALLGNFVRVITLCLITYHFGEKVGQSFLHEFSGLVIFVILTFGLLGLDRLFGSPLTQQPSGSVSPVIQRQPPPPLRSYYRCALASAILMSLLAATYLVPKPKEGGGNLLQEITVPQSMPGWRSIDGSALIAGGKDDRYNFIKDYSARVYGTKDGRSLLFIILDAGNFHHPRVCFSCSGYQVQELDPIIFSIGNNSLRVHPLITQKGPARYLVLYWLVMDGKQTNWAGQKWKQLWRSLLRQNRPGLMMRLDMPVVSTDGQAELEYAKTFIQALAATTPLSARRALLGF